MAEFLTTHGTSHYIESIIISSRKTLTLISPYLKLPEIFSQRLAEASNRGVKIKLVFGKEELKDEELRALNQLRNFELYYLHDLHAKCYFNDDKMVITSMNMYEYSLKNNREMGIMVDAKIDNVLFECARNEADSIINNSIRINSINRRGMYRFSNSTEKQPKPISHRGFCIRCSLPIKHNESRPYCGDCYSTWAQFSNSSYIEKFCHSCGKPESTSLERPECYGCYSLTA